MSFAGFPRPRADASICDPSLANQQELIQGWLQTAVRVGSVGGLWEGGFPRYVWFKTDEVVYEARLINREQGQYKGYQLEREEWPTRIEDYYE